MFDRRLIMNFDWPLLVTVVLIAVMGVATIYSSTFPHPGDFTPPHVKQIYWLLLGMALMFFILSFDYRTLVRYAYPFLLFCLILLILVMFFGRLSSGSQRWLQLGLFSFQPSELTRMALLLSLTR